MKKNYRSRRGTVKRAKTQHIKRHISLPFLIAIPAQFFLGGIFSLSFITLFNNYLLEKEIWALFAVGLVSAFTVLRASSIRSFRTFIHEFKHAIVIFLTGNRLRDFHFEAGTGHVKYEMYANRVHFAPFIALAPYCLPLLSFPAMLLCVAFEDSHRMAMTLFLGLSLGADLSMGISEIHPHQTDIRKITGGLFASTIYLVGVHFFWISACLLWVVAGWRGYWYALWVAISLVQ